MDIASDDTTTKQIISPSTTMPVAVLTPDHLDVYGWESSLWKKIRGYLGF